MQNLSVNELIEDPVSISYMPKLVKIDWLGQVGNVLGYAQNVAKTIKVKKQNVLIYCHLGISGTPLLTSLAQLFLDPFYRTFQGFRILVHKEWVYYQHNFRKKGLLLFTGEK